MWTAQAPSSPSTYGRSPVRTVRTKASSWALSGSWVSTSISSTSPGERRRVAGDERAVGQVRLRERQALGEVVELEHALLADDDELATLGRRQPVHVEHPGRARREVQQPEQQVLVRGVLALGQLRVDARRPLAGDPAQHVGVVGGEVDRHADVADARRERARAPADDGEDAGEPALAQQLAQAQDRGVVALDVADLDRHARPARPAATIASASACVAASGFSTRTGTPRSIAAWASGLWNVVGAAMIIASSSVLARSSPSGP